MSIKWDSQAADMVDQAPALVRTMIKKRVEAFAHKRGIKLVTPELVTSLREKQGKHKPKKFNISDLYANSENPLTNAFDSKNGIHIFSQGDQLARKDIPKFWADSIVRPVASDMQNCLYIHIPFCKSRCVFCPFFANKWNKDELQKYCDYLIREIKLLENTTLAQADLDAVYFGGGTPSDLNPDQLADIMQALHSTVKITAKTEVTLEGRIFGHTPDLTKAALDNGVNRFSFGVQSFNTKIRRSLGRKDDRSYIIKFLNSLAEKNAAVVIDLIYGLPGQTMQDWLADLKCLTEETQIDGVDLYKLKTIPGSTVDDLIDSGKLPGKADHALQAEMFAAGCEFMSGRNWQQLSNVHWRQTERENSIYNLLAKAGANCIPLGCGSGGRIHNHRVMQSGDLDKYYSYVDQDIKPVTFAQTFQKNIATVDAIILQSERGYLEPGKWSGLEPGHYTLLGKLFKQWSQAGLCREESAGVYRLTVAGQYWAVQMGTKLVTLINQ